MSLKFKNTGTTIDSFLEDTCQADKIRSEIKVLKCVNLRLLNLQDSVYNYYYSVRFMLFLNLFVSVLIEIILIEKKVMLRSLILSNI